MKVYEARDPIATFILAHGAGAGSSHPWMVAYAKALASRNVRVVTFDFPYMTAKRKLPDRPNVLEETYRAIATQVHERFPHEPLAIGGKSMGGRIASQITAKHTLPISALVFYGYPLHPPDKPKTRRDAHLPDVKLPMLFVSGTRDGFATPAELRALVRKLGPHATYLPIAQGDHSLIVPKRGAEKQDDVDARIWNATRAFVAQSK